MYYSFVVRSERDVPIKEHLLVIGEGLDTFNATVPDLDAFMARLKAEGVTVLEVHQLDGLEPIPAPKYLPGDDLPLLK